MDAKDPRFMLAVSLLNATDWLTKAHQELERDNLIDCASMIALAQKELAGIAQSLTHRYARRVGQLTILLDNLKEEKTHGG